MHPAKRRRVDAAKSTLTKPFRSPLHVDPSQKSTPSPEKLDDRDLAVQESNTAPLSARTGEPTRINSSPLRNAQSSRLRPYTTSLSSPIKPTRPSRPPQDPVYTTLQKQHSSLTLQLKNLNQSLDVATQALRYTTTSTNSDLRTLIQKWRTITRDLAEELFLTAKDRVNKMGGVGAWRDKYTKNQDDNNNTSWGMGDNQEIDEDDLTDEQKEQLEYMRDEAMKEARKYGLDRPEEKEVNDEKDHDTFTMDMMLKQLNVDLELIGYDKVAQRWVD